jgi:hypothetical protein
LKQHYRSHRLGHASQLGDGLRGSRSGGDFGLANCGVEYATLVRQIVQIGALVAEPQTSLTRVLLGLGDILVVRIDTRDGRTCAMRQPFRRRASSTAGDDDLLAPLDVG